MKGAIGFSTSSEREAPLKRLILVFGAFSARYLARAGKKRFGSPDLVNPLMAMLHRSVTCFTASSTGTTLLKYSLHSTRSFSVAMITTPVQPGGLVKNLTMMTT